MSCRNILILIIFLLLSTAGLSACESEVTPTATAVPPTATAASSPTARPDPEPAGQTEGVFFSELLPGVPGGNSQEFIELYNAGSEPVDLLGWSIFYLLGDDQEQALVYRWTETAVIPPRGHILLVREGQTVGAAADGFFTQALFERKGGLLLRNKTQQAVDFLGWGDAPSAFTSGNPVPAPASGSSLERLPGGDAGNGQDSGNNAADFVPLAAPNPQNSGSPTTPQPDEFLTINIIAPTTIAPGTQFALTVEVGNVSDTAVDDVIISVPLANHFELLAAPDGAERADGRLVWQISQIAANGRQTTEISLQSPFTYIDTLLTGYFADADGYLAAFGPPFVIAMSGGSIPIATARTLVGSTVTVEGVATMYSGGFFAGSTSTKFYIQDESGGVQVFVPGGMNSVNVQLGDRVRVSGEIEIFRDSVEVIPADLSGDIEIVARGEPLPDPRPVSSTELESAVGQYVVAEGTITRIEEFNFSYEVDLQDAAGGTVLVYIEKDTGVTAEPLVLGSRYRTLGVGELVSGQLQLKPRQQTDLAEIFPPVLLVNQSGPVSVQVGDVVSYTVTAVNHTPNQLTNLIITAVPPVINADVELISDDGAVAGGEIVWNIDNLPGNGGSVSVNYQIRIHDLGLDSIGFAPATAVADQWPNPASSTSFRTFIGRGVPIWAIQGSDDRSPYVGIEADTRGVVTAVFPELNGFFIQDLEPDDNPATSDALFVFTGVLPISVEMGDLLEINGRVREISGQTTLQVDALSDIVLNRSGYLNVFDPIPYDPPRDPAESQVYNESLEGVLVTLAEPALVVGPTTRFGEYALVYEKWGVASVARTDSSGFLMFVDDGSTVAHNDQSNLPYVVASGDVVENLTGPLAYTFGSYKIEPIGLPDVSEGERPLPAIRPAENDEFSVATFNVENLYDLLTPHPSSPPLPTVFEYRAKLDKIAQTIVAMGAPTVIGLQEVENLSVLQDLVAQEAIAAFGYEPYLVEGNDSRGIDVGYLVRGDRATVLSVAAYDAPGDLFARPPLVITITAQLATGEQTVILLNNHFLSLSAGEEATEPVRQAQAAWNAMIVEELATNSPDAYFVVLGDLNSFYQTLPIDTLEDEAGLQHVYRFLPEEERPYTYIFEGRTQTLDHILVCPALFEQLVLVQALHTNADFPIGDPQDSTLYRVSDHDPLVAIFNLGN